MVPSEVGYPIRSVKAQQVVDSAAPVTSLLQFADESYPSVVVRNQLGEEHRLFKAASWQEAVAKRDRLRGELHAMGLEAWCHKYAVPTTFAELDDTGRPSQN